MVLGASVAPNGSRYEVVKVQRPLSGAGEWLVYDRRRERSQHIPERRVTPKVKKAMGQDLKAFFLAAYDSAKGWTIGRRTAAEPW